MSVLDGFKKVMAEVRSGSFRPVYLLHGEEPFFIDRVAEGSRPPRSPRTTSPPTTRAR